jgi:hypothetical protein
MTWVLEKMSIYSKITITTFVCIIKYMNILLSKFWFSHFSHLFTYAHGLWVIEKMTKYRTTFVCINKYINNPLTNFRFSHFLTLFTHANGFWVLEKMSKYRKITITTFVCINNYINIPFSNFRFSHFSPFSPTRIAFGSKKKC